MKYTITAVPEASLICDECPMELRWFARHRVECTDVKTEAFTSWVRNLCDRCWADEQASWDQRVAFVDLPPVPRAAPMVTWQAWALQNAQSAGDWHGR